MGDAPREDHEPDRGQLSVLLAAAREGTSGDVGRLFEATRRYLLLVANRSLDAQLHQKIAPSDLVQETFIDAHRDFNRFSGDSEAELFAWLCQILLHKAADAGRRYHGTAKRNVKIEVPLGEQSNAPGMQVADDDLSPSATAMSSEHEQRLNEALAQLPEDYRQVITLRSLERLTFPEVGRRMGRSEDAAGKLWFRALQRLRDELAGRDESGLTHSR